MFMFKLPYGSLTFTLGRMSLEVFMFKLLYGSLTCTLGRMSLKKCSCLNYRTVFDLYTG